MIPILIICMLLVSVLVLASCEKKDDSNDIDETDVTNSVDDTDKIEPQTNVRNRDTQSTSKGLFQNSPDNDAVQDIEYEYDSQQVNE